MFNPTTFYSVLTPMYNVTKVFGLTPFKIDYRGCRHSNIQLLWNILLMLFLCIYAFASIKASGFNHQIIAGVTNILDVYFGIAQILFGILFGCLYRDVIIHVLQQIKEIDGNMQTFLQVNIISEYRKGKIYSVLALSIVIMWSAGSFAYISEVNKHYFTIKTLGRFISDTFPYLISVLIELQFCTLLFCLKQRFSWLNTKIIEIYKMLEIYTNREQTARFTLAAVYDRSVNFIQAIRANHYQLCTISQTVNNAYSIQILLIILQSFITIIVALYYTGKVISIDKIFPVRFLIYGAVLITGAIGQLLLLVIACACAASEAQQAGVLIHKITILNAQTLHKCEEDLQLEIAFFSFQLLHHNLQFTACKLFVIDETLLLWITEAVTSYLIIVLQFESEDSEA